MWELIRVNKRNSVLLLGAMGSVLLLLGFVLGSVFGHSPQAGWIGLGIATVIWLVMTATSLSGGDKILLASSKAVPVTADVHPMLFNVVEEMAIAANLPKMPKVYIINDPAPNAFATGRNPENASVAVTAGLLAKLNRDELQGVIAHEISHIIHRDILFVTMAGVMLGSIVLISQIFLRGMFYSSLGSRRRYSSSRGQGSGQAQIIMLVAAILFAILAPILTQLLYFALSRKREYLADAGGVRLTRYPEGLAGALEKIAGSNVNMESANKVTAPMYIANPFRGKKAMNLYSTHPPIQERVRILRNMSHGAAFIDYEKSYEQVTKRSAVVPTTALKPEDVSIREASAESKSTRTAKQQARQIGDLMRTVSAFAFLTCGGCGLKMKIPPEYKADKVKCPRCKKNSQIRKMKDL